jgi:hypothetical protein
LATIARNGSHAPTLRQPTDMQGSPDLPPHPVTLVTISLAGAAMSIGAFKVMGWLLVLIARIFS